MINYDNLPFKSDSVSHLLKTLHQNNVIRFTKFNNKAGQSIPYDFRIDRCCSSVNINIIGEMMADRVIEIEKDLNLKFDSIFCSLFSGVFIGVSASMWLLHKYGRNINLAISRRSYAQEIGEGSGKEKFISSIHMLKNKTLIGALGENVLVFDEMTNTGVTIQELINISKFNGTTPKAVMIIADRILQPMEDGCHIRMYDDIPCYSSITHFEILNWYEENKELWSSLEQTNIENQNRFNNDDIAKFECFLNEEMK
jgi:orotate phosphoribosyltransferase